VTERARCEGFTRPTCEPCPLEDEILVVRVDCLGKVETKVLCRLCRSRLLRPAVPWDIG